MIDVFEEDFAERKPEFNLKNVLILMKKKERNQSEPEEMMYLLFLLGKYKFNYQEYKEALVGLNYDVQATVEKIQEKEQKDFEKLLQDQFRKFHEI